MAKFEELLQTNSGILKLKINSKYHYNSKNNFNVTCFTCYHSKIKTKFKNEFQILKFQINAQLVWLFYKKFHFLLEVAKCVRVGKSLTNAGEKLTALV
ncbi:hypothetical protein BpHYR1_044534 [Brachionus plicatilis]|uniref:Uncharacterized protein n=1 Tax=Brachionus plicatilis TaxID=10195 RepID=A0A3M7QFU6_BRAPC|nr:hypothetical protein BpHYR1_044534 [Brachionus plicatilis]